MLCSNALPQVYCTPWTHKKQLEGARIIYFPGHSAYNEAIRPPAGGKSSRNGGTAMKMNAYRNAMVEAVSRLVAIPSVFEQDEGTPFGPQVDRCLDEALDLMKELGLRTFKAPDGMYGYAETGEGELFGVLCHLDVVQARQEDGWEHDPFAPMVQGDALCGRGTQDDKGPTVAAAYALKSLLDEGAPLRMGVG